MLQSLRGFLIDAGNLLTAAFVSDARSFIRRTGEALLVSPAQAAQTLCWYDFDTDPQGYLLSLGPWVETQPDPCFEVYELLRRIDLGPDLASARGSFLEFHEVTGPGGSESCFVNARGKLSLSLLQARLIDLKMPIKIVAGGVKSAAA